MKKYLLIVILFFTFSTDLKANWMNVIRDDGQGNSWWVKMDEIGRKDHILYYRYGVNWKEPAYGIGYSTIVIKKVNCNTLEDKVISGAYYNDKLGLGEIVGELETQETWHPNEKNSVGHTMNEFVCRVSSKW